MPKAEVQTPPVTIEPQAPFIPQLEIERRGMTTVPMVHHFPQVLGGVCEHCGIVDDKYLDFQYKICPHFRFLRGGNLACSYCPSEKDQKEVVRSHTLNVYTHPTNPRQVVVVCDDYTCTNAHFKRFQVNS